MTWNHINLCWSLWMVHKKYVALNTKRERKTNIEARNLCFFMPVMVTKWVGRMIALFWCHFSYRNRKARRISWKFIIFGGNLRHFFCTDRDFFSTGGRNKSTYVTSRERWSRWFISDICDRLWNVLTLN